MKICSFTTTALNFNILTLHSLSCRCETRARQFDKQCKPRALFACGHDCAVAFILKTTEGEEFLQTHGHSKLGAFINYTVH